MANTIASPSSNRHQLDKPTHENLAREVLEVRVVSGDSVRSGRVATTPRISAPMRLDKNDSWQSGFRAAQGRKGPQRTERLTLVIYFVRRRIFAVVVGDDDSFSTDTPVALIMAKTASPFLRFIRLTEPVVMIEVTGPAAVLMTISETTLSNTICSIVPGK
jgi:hypothetical protein